MKERCREVLARAYLYIDGELPEAERLQMEAHLQDCAPCYERLGLEEEVARLIARLRGNCRCPDSLRTRILALLLEPEDDRAL